jgi:hypothetical protein
LLRRLLLEVIVGVAVSGDLDLEVLLWRSIWLLLVSRVVVVVILLIAEARIEASSAMIVGHGALTLKYAG